jgi:hypothetical protein
MWREPEKPKPAHTSTAARAVGTVKERIKPPGVRRNTVFIHTDAIIP